MPEELIFVGAALLVTAIGAGIRHALATQMSSNIKSLPANPEQNLRPAELAYLLRPGDMTHTFVVIAVDLVQRAVKRADHIPLVPYEKEVWGNIKERVAEWAQGKFIQHVPISKPQSPTQLLTQFKLVRQLLENLRAFAEKLIQDPLHIRKYFSLPGIARLALDFYSSGYKASVESSLRTELLNKSFLSSVEQRQSVARSLAIFLFANIVVMLVLVIFLIGPMAPLARALLLFFSIADAVLIHFLLFLPSFIPFYDELTMVVADLNRAGFRFSALRMVLGGGRAVFRTVAALLVLLLCLIQIGLCTWIFQLQFWLCAAAFFSLLCLNLLNVRTALDIRKFLVFDQATPYARKIIALHRQKIEQIRPLESLKQLVSSNSYEPTFSEVVAFYGIETLWLLS